MNEKKNWMARSASFFTGDPSPLARDGAVAVIGVGPLVERAGASAGFMLAAVAALAAAVLAIWAPRHDPDC